MNVGFTMPGLFRRKSLLVLGLARSGCAAAELLLDDGARVTGADEDVRLDLPTGLEKMRVELGAFTMDLLEDIDGIVLSPGIPMDNPLVLEAARRTIPVMSELELGYRYSKAKVIAVTGTNGKSTTVSMTGRILETAGYRVVVAGNVGLPFCSVVRNLGTDGIFVLEVSSFQLETVSSFHPAVAGLLNLTPDHLDRYNDIAEYFGAKARILENLGSRDVLFYNALDEECTKLADTFAGTKIPFSSAGSVENGVYLEGETLVRVRNGAEETFMERSMLGVVGLHNVENALAAVAATSPFDVSREACRGALSGFMGLPHRMEQVGTVDDIIYYNDSKATNVEATVMSLKGLDRKAILIAGGKDKGSDFSKLHAVLDRVKAIVTLGEAAPLIEEAIGSAVPIARAGTMQEAVEIASRTAGKGEIVLLSPACASFDMFTNFEHRGEVFTSCVKNLQKAAR